MSKKIIFSTLLLLIIFANQGNAQSLNTLKEINEVWEKFYRAFDSLDYTQMAQIHSKKLIRISGGTRISDYDTYINNYKRQFAGARENGITNRISLRFFERINNDSIASERGIYKLTRTQNEQIENTYYGQFHVLFIKENNKWKILVDYDSSERNTIGEKDYIKASGIDEFDSFINN